MWYVVLTLIIIILCILNIYQFRYIGNLKLRYIKKCDLVTKNDRITKMLAKWLEQKTKSGCIYDYLKTKNYTSVIIYGMHYIGEILVDSLKDTDIKIVCCIDKKNNINRTDIPVIRPDDEIPKADIIIVSAVTAFQEIDEFLYDKVCCPVVSLEDIIYSQKQ